VSLRSICKVFVVALLFAAFSGVLSGYSEVVDKVIVVVNDEVITQREFDRAFRPISDSYKANFEGEELEKRLKEVKQAFMEQLINTKIAISEAKKKNIEIDEAGLEERITRIKGMYGSEEIFLQALNEKGTNLTEFTKDIRDQMMAQKLVESEIASKIVITPSEISDLYTKNKEQLISPQRVKIKGIMVRKDEEAPAQNSRKKIEDVQANLIKGADFSETAKQFSEGPYAAEGGEMGYVVRGQLLEEMDEIIFSAKKNDVTDIIETRIGYHIFIIEDVEEPRNLELTEVSDFLKGQIFRKRFEQSLLEWLEEKRKNAYISYK